MWFGICNFESTLKNRLSAGNRREKGVADGYLCKVCCTTHAKRCISRRRAHAAASHITSLRFDDFRSGVEEVWLSGRKD